jgi:hypothetical protein
LTEVKNKYTTNENGIHIESVLMNICNPQALFSFKKYMPPPLPYFKVNICSFPLPHFASIFFAYS